MPITSSQILRVINKPDGISVYEQHTDHLGKIHSNRYSTFVGDDLDLNLATNAPKVEQGFIDAELDRVASDIISGSDPASLTYDYLTYEQSVRSMMKIFLTSPAIDIMHMLPWVQSFSTPDLNGLGFTAAERGQITAREGTINGVKALLETDNLFILEDF